MSLQEDKETMKRMLHSGELTVDDLIDGLVLWKNRAEWLGGASVEFNDLLGRLKWSTSEAHHLSAQLQALVTSLGATVPHKPEMWKLITDYIYWDLMAAHDRNPMTLIEIGEVRTVPPPPISFAAKE